MSVIFIVVPLATLVVLVAVIAFVISVRRGQFDDLDTPAVRMLYDESSTPNSSLGSRKSSIPTMGTLVRFEDAEGNDVSATKYDWPPRG